MPISVQPVVPISACFTPAGLPGASGPEVSAAMAVVAAMVAAKATAISVRIFPSVSCSFF
jgi:hypothetical protein